MEKVVILGGGGREHAIADKFAESISEKNIFVLPGNGGINGSRPVDVSDFEAIKSFCNKHNIKLIFVGPEQPLAEGIVDFFSDTDIQVFGPDKQTAQLEASKIFAKKFAQKYGVSTADFQAFENTRNAREYIKSKNGNCVIKLDGLAGGKGVFVCSNTDEAFAALKEIETKYGENAPFLIEDKISGDELSLIGFTDGKSIKLLQSSQDHKQLNEGDKGPNTGGMGAYSPVPNINDELMQKIRQKIVEPSLKGILAEKMNYKGVLYFGIMVKDGEAYLLEYNIRFGDPETEVLLPALKTDLLEITRACLNGKLAEVELSFRKGSFADVVLVSGGYPGAYQKGFEIQGLDRLSPDTIVYHAGTSKKNGKICSSGGRVLNIVCKGENLQDSLDKVYSEIKKIRFKDMYYRRDIGKRKNPYL